MTLAEGHWNLHPLERFAKGCLCAGFPGCSYDSVWENTNSFSTFYQYQPCEIVTVNLDEGHLDRYGLKGLVTKYLCAKFHDCGDHSVWESVDFEFFVILHNLIWAVTLGEGHSTQYVLKRLVTMQHCAKCHDCSDHSIWENVPFHIRHRALPFRFRQCRCSDLGSIVGLHVKLANETYAHFWCHITLCVERGEMKLRYSREYQKFSFQMYCLQTKYQLCNFRIKTAKN